MSKIPGTTKDCASTPVSMIVLLLVLYVLGGVLIHHAFISIVIAHERGLLGSPGTAHSMHIRKRSTILLALSSVQLGA